MIVKQKAVYYCGFCRKHGLSRPSMEKHELVCTMNPERVCRWKVDGHADGMVDLLPLIAHLRERAPLVKDDIDWLHDEVDGCPPCMLAVLRQSGLEYHYAPSGERMWDYMEEVEAFRKDEREQQARDLW